MKPESVTVVGFAGGQMEYRLNVSDGNIWIETWIWDGITFKKNSENKFKDTTNAWIWIGEQLFLYNG